MKYRKTLNRIILIAWSTLAVMFVMCFITLNDVIANNLFYPPVNYDVGDGNYTAAIGDLNKDSAADLAVVNSEDDDVSVLLGNGDGTFQSAVNYGAGDYP